MKADSQESGVSLRTIGELLLEGSASFNHLAWKTRPTFNRESSRDALASMHEWCHHELNNTTSYGLLLVYFATIARYATADRDKYCERLGELVARCFVTHEVYATWYSVELLCAQHDKGDLLILLPPDYRAFHAQGERIVAGIDSPFLRRQAFLTVIRSCFEAQIFSCFSFDASEHFRMSDVRALDLPDALLERVLALVPSVSFMYWVDAFCEEASADDALVIRSAVAHNDAGGLDHLMIGEADAVLGRFLSWLSVRWNERLLEAGLAANPYESHLNLLSALVADANTRCCGIVLRSSIDDAGQSPGSLRTLLRQADAEVVLNRDIPLPLVITPIRELDKSRWSDLPVGNEPRHLLVQARPALSLRQQHSLGSDSFSGASDESPMVVIRHREPPGSAGVGRARAFLFQRPSELVEIIAAADGATCVGLVSSQLLSDPQWQDQWLIPSVFWVVKIDHSLHDFLHEHCRAQAQVLYSTSTINDRQRVIRLLCFLTRAEDELNWQLFIGLCGDNTAKACRGFIEQALDSDRVVRDDSQFGTVLAPALRIIGSHLIRDEYFFSFDHLHYT